MLFWEIFIWFMSGQDFIADHIIIRILLFLFFFCEFIFTICAVWWDRVKKKRKFLYANYRENCAPKEGKAAYNILVQNCEIVKYLYNI